MEIEDAVPDAAEASELEMLSGQIPKLIGILPDVLHDKPGTGDQCRAALSHMLSRLLDCVDPSAPVSLRLPHTLDCYLACFSFAYNCSCFDSIFFLFCFGISRQRLISNPDWWMKRQL